MSGIKLGRPNPNWMQDSYQWQEMQKNKSTWASSFGEAILGMISLGFVLLILSAAFASISVRSPAPAPVPASTNALP